MKERGTVGEEGKETGCGTQGIYRNLEEKENLHVLFFLLFPPPLRAYASVNIRAVAPF